MTRKPPPGLIASAEQDYQDLQDRLTEAVAGARVLLVGRSSEVEALADVYSMLSRAEPRIAAGIGAAAVMHLAKRAKGQEPDGQPADDGFPERSEQENGTR